MWQPRSPANYYLYNTIENACSKKYFTFAFEKKSFIEARLLSIMREHFGQIFNVI